MRKLFFAAAILFASITTTSQAFDLKSILNGVNVGDAVSGVVDGLLTQSDISVEQMAGTWTATGSAVSFQSENFLKKAGGSAAAGTIEGKLNPYFQKYGLTGSVLTVQSDGSFTLKVKSITLSGKITKSADGNFNFTFSAFNKVNIGTIKTYVEKTVSGLNVMFDASKLKTFMSAVTKLTGNSLASTAGNILDSYEGLCVGFAFQGKSTYTGTGGSTGTQNPTDALKNALDALKNR